MHKSLAVLMAAALLASTAVHAQQNNDKTGAPHFKWTDARGLLHFSDSLNEDAIKNGYDIVNSQGMVVRRVSRTLNPQERAAAQKLAAQQAAAQRAAQEQTRTDQQMLAAYPDEASYRASLKQALDTQDQQIRTSQLNLLSQEQSLTDLLARAAALEHNKQPLPKTLQDSIAKQRVVVSELHTVLSHQQTQRSQTAHQQAQQLAHYRAVQAAQAQQP